MMMMMMMMLLQTHGPVYIEYQVTMTFHRRQSASYIVHTDLLAGTS